MSFAGGPLDAFLLKMSYTAFAVNVSLLSFEFSLCTSTTFFIRLIKPEASLARGVCVPGLIVLVVVVSNSFEKVVSPKGYGPLGVAIDIVLLTILFVPTTTPFALIALE